MILSSTLITFDILLRFRKGILTRGVRDEHERRLALERSIAGEEEAAVAAPEALPERGLGQNSVPTVKATPESTREDEAKDVVSPSDIQRKRKKKRGPRRQKGPKVTRIKI